MAAEKYSFWKTPAELPELLIHENDENSELPCDISKILLIEQASNSESDKYVLGRCYQAQESKEVFWLGEEHSESIEPIRWIYIPE